MTHHVDDDSRVTEQAARWFSTLLDGDDRRAEFFAWLAESPRHVEEFLLVLADAQDIAAVDAARRDRIDQLSRERFAASVSQGAIPLSQRALHSLEDRTVHGVHSDPQGRVPHRPRVAFLQPFKNLARRIVRSGRPRLGVAITAAMLLAMIGTIAWLVDPGAQTYATRLGEQRAFALADGSLVHLNTDSRITVRLTDSSRSIRLLRGEAFFDVEHDATRPFRVHSANAVIRAIGTRFNVYRQTSTTRVSVVEGLVQISPAETPPSLPIAVEQRPADAPVALTSSQAEREKTGASPRRLLAAGEAVEISARGEVSRRKDVDVAKALARQQRRLVFENDTLATIAEEFNRYNVGTKIRVIGSTAASEHFSGTFDANAPDAVMHALVGDSTLIITRTGNEIVIRDRNEAVQAPSK